MRRTLAAVAVLILVAAVFLPLAAGSHNYGHRYIVLGRVLDSDGNPVQNQDVRITTKLGDQVQGQVVTSTDCLGDFYSPDGTDTRAGPRVERSAADGKTYFHYHNPELSSLIDVEIQVAGEIWVEDFRTGERYTLSRHQLAQAHPPAEQCGGDFSNFNSTFRADVVMFTESEHNYQTEDVVNPRPVEVSFEVDGEAYAENGTTDPNGRAVFTFEGVNVTAGASYTVSGEAVGEREETFTDDDVKYRRADNYYRISGDGGGPNTALLWFGGIVGAAGLIFLGFLGVNKLKEKRELSKAYEQSGRKRARRKP